MSDGIDKPGRVGGASSNRKPADKAERKRARGKGNGGDVGRVLKSVYDSTLAEDVPPDFLDLLGKLD